MTIVGKNVCQKATFQLSYMFDVNIIVCYNDYRTYTIRFVDYDIYLELYCKL